MANRPPPILQGHNDANTGFRHEVFRCYEPFRFSVCDGFGMRTLMCQRVWFGQSRSERESTRELHAHARFQVFAKAQLLNPLGSTALCARDCELHAPLSSAREVEQHGLAARREKDSGRINSLYSLS